MFLRDCGMLAQPFEPPEATDWLDANKSSSTLQPTTQCGNDFLKMVRQMMEYCKGKNDVDRLLRFN